ncbi:MAG: DUF748 domain-containing protein, partial [Burkholderiales bacterium]
GMAALDVIAREPGRRTSITEPDATPAQEPRNAPQDEAPSGTTDQRPDTQPTGRRQPSPATSPSGLPAGLDDQAAEAQSAAVTATRRAPIAPARSTPPSAGDGSAPAPSIRIGAIELASGEVQFTDHFIQPNYSARLTQLKGNVTALSSEPGQPARVQVVGRLDDSAPLTISGSIDPLAPQLALDLRGEAKGFELTGLSAYSAKYAGYGIRKGKLSARVRYTVAEGELQASNRIVLDQLTFGDKVDSPTATKLPVAFAVALLKDSNGIIDVELPVSGSLSDPEFSIAAVIAKAVGNLIVKIATAPFRVLGALAGAASTDLSYVEFAAGGAALDDDARGKLRTMLDALQERPGLALELRGHADREADGAILKARALEDRLRALKASALAAAGEPAPEPDAPLGAEERAGLLRQLYLQTIVERGAPAPAAPGGRRSSPPVPPVEEIERQLLARIGVADEALIELAGARARAVREFIAGTELDPQRVFMVASRIGLERGTGGDAEAEARAASQAAPAGAAGAATAPAATARPGAPSAGQKEAGEVSEAAPASGPDTARVVQFSIRPHR